MRESHRAEAERLLTRAVEEEVRRSGGRIDGAVLLSRGRGAWDTIAGAAVEEYALYEAALAEAGASRRPLSERFGSGALGTPALVAGVAAASAVAADMAFGTGAGTALGTGVVVAVAGTATGVARVASSGRPAGRAGAAEQARHIEQLRLQWLSALEVRGIRPYLDQQQVLTRATRRTSKKSASGPKLRGSDRSAAARRRSVLEQSFGHLPRTEGPFAGRREAVGQIARWVHAARASTETKPTVVVLHGAPGSGRTTLAVRAADQLKDQFRGRAWWTCGAATRARRRCRPGTRCCIC